MAGGDFDYLSPQQCIDTFAVDYLSGRSALVLLSNDFGESNNTVLWSDWGSIDPSEPYAWMCDDDSYWDCSKDIIDSGNWSVLGTPWRFPTLDVDFPSKNSKLSFNMRNLSVPGFCYDPTVEPKGLCIDIQTLLGFLNSYRDKDQLDDFLRQPGPWVNTSWAAEVTVQQRPECSVLTVEPQQRVEPQPRTNYTIEGCLSQKTSEDCQLLFSLPFCLAVLGCNVIKVICMFLTAHDNRAERFLTVGDAISSFLLKPDPTTRGRCLMSRLNLRGGSRSWNLNGITSPRVFRSSNEARGSEYRVPEVLPSHKRWFHAANLFHWTVTMAMYVASSYSLL